MILVEFFDLSPIDNLLASISLCPERLIMVTDRERFSQRRLDEFKRFLTIYNSNIELEIKLFKSTSKDSINNVCDEIYTQHQNPYFNLTGGGELVASAVTLWAANHKVILFYIDGNSKRLIPLTGDDLTDYPIEMPSLSVAEVIALSGGEYKRSDHLQPNLEDKKLLDLIDNSFRVFLKYHSRWHSLSGFIQQAKRYIVEGSNPVEIRSKTHFTIAEGRSVDAPMDIICALAKVGVIEGLEHGSNFVNFRIPREEMLPLLSMHGSFLELFCYIEAMRSEYFYDVKGSVVIDGDGPLKDFAEMQNEIDLICTKGITALFISCKSSLPTPLALSEIKLLSMRFGGENAKAVMVTAADIYGDNPALYKRALELGISLIDLSDLSAKQLQKRLIDISEGKE